MPFVMTEDLNKEDMVRRMQIGGTLLDALTERGCECEPCRVQSYSMTAIITAMFFFGSPADEVRFTPEDHEKIAGRIVALLESINQEN